MHNVRAETFFKFYLILTWVLCRMLCHVQDAAKDASSFVKRVHLAPVYIEQQWKNSAMDAMQSQSFQISNDDLCLIACALKSWR